MTKTTKADYEKFKSYVSYWQRELGLDDWHIYVYHKKLDDTFANTTANTAGRGVTINFSTNWLDREINDKELKECALHEVLHIITAPMNNEAKARFADEYTLDAAEHSIVTRLTNYIMRVQ